jgi:hypothetical protein
MPVPLTPRPTTGWSGSARRSQREGQEPRRDEGDETHEGRPRRGAAHIGPRGARVAARGAGRDSVLPPSPHRDLRGLPASSRHRGTGRRGCCVLSGGCCSPTRAKPRRDEGDEAHEGRPRRGAAHIGPRMPGWQHGAPVGTAFFPHLPIVTFAGSLRHRAIVVPAGAVAAFYPGGVALPPGRNHEGTRRRSPRRAATPRSGAHRPACARVGSTGRRSGQRSSPISPS